MAYETDTTIEASSLSTITALASHPPQHLGIPVKSIGAPLVLYIARVPGSRDVFLTPMKPREKVVTAEDVQSSLYFVHVNDENDHEVLEEPRTPSSANSDVSQFAPSQESEPRRKPVKPTRPMPPISPPYPVSDQMPHVDQGPPSPRKSQQIARKPVNGSNTTGQLPYPTALDLPEIPRGPRRPLPTPPDEQIPHRNSLHADNVRLLRHSEHSDDTNPYFRRYSADMSNRIPDVTDVPPLEAGSLTLIRRDPGSNEQWNVALIHDPPVHEVSSSALLHPSSAQRTKKGAPLYLDITNPGYGQFIDKDRPVSQTSTSTQSSDSEPAPEGTFRRRLYMPGSRYGEHGYGHRRFKSADSGGGMPRTMHKDPLSNMANGGSSTWDRRSKDYSFTSPWEGKCEFTTGATGKNLKCRHTFVQQGTVEFSELRFNLPSASRNIATPASEKRASYFSRHSRLLSSDDGDKSPAPSVVIGDDGKVDLTLGQEKAGGGMGGKQAKLGKLIIGPEGMKMLDLLVAANMGLWWRAYEKA